MKLTAVAVGVLVVGLMIQFASSARGETFGPNIRVNNDTNLDRNVPVLAVGWDGTVYAAWQDKSSDEWRIMFAHAPGSGGTFTGHVQVSIPTIADAIQQSPDIGYWNETVYVVWQESGFEGDVIMFNSIPQPSGLPQFAKQIAQASVGWCYAPAIAVGPNGTIYVAYSENSMNIKLVASYDGGHAWTNGSLVSSSTVNTRSEQRVAVDPLGKVYVTWRDGRNGMIDRPGGTQVEDDDVYIANSTDGGRTFGPDTPVNDVIAGKVQSSPSIAVDGNGRVHIAWKDERFEPNECTDIFYAGSDDGVHFGQNTPVNDTSPVLMSPRRTTHQEPWIQVDPTGQNIYIAWVDDRGTKHNIYLAKSTDGGATFRPAREDDPLTEAAANVFIDDASAYNGIRDANETAILDNGDGVLSPGMLDGSPDSVVEPGKANLQSDPAGDHLRYHDTNGDGSWTKNEDIVMSGPSGVFPRIRPAVLGLWDTTGQGISLLYLSDGLAMDIGPGMVLAVDSFDTDLVGLAPTDPISAASLELMYRADSAYTGTAPVNWAIQGDVNNSWFTPADTGGLYTNVSIDLYALGITSVATLRDLNVSFVSNGAGDVYIDRIGLNVTEGIADKFDALDTIIYDGANPTALGDPLTSFLPADRLMFVDVNMTGHYEKGDPLILTSAVVLPGGDLQSTDEVLPRADGLQWRTFFNPFPINYDFGYDPMGNNNNFRPRIILNPFGYITAIWQDWRSSAGPNIYAATTDSPESFGPYMTFYMETDQNRAGPGGNVSYSIWVRNTGGISAKAVNVSNALPAGLEFITSDPAPNITVGQQRWWDLGFMSSLGFEKIVIQARINSTLPYNTVLGTSGTLSFTDVLGGARPLMHAWLDFIASDLIPPVITHTPPGDAKTNDHVTIEGTATDDVGIATVRLYIKPIGASYFNSPQEQTPSSDGHFSFTYNVGSSPGTVEYYLVAVDTSGNDASSPPSAPSAVNTISVTESGWFNSGTIPVILGAVLLVGVILAVVFFFIMRKKKREPSTEVEDEAGSPPPA